MEKKIELTLPLVNALLQCLGTRPYQEVFALVVEIQQQASPQVQQEQAAKPQPQAAEPEGETYITANC